MRYIIVTEHLKITEIFGVNKITKQDLDDCKYYPITIIDSDENKVYNGDEWEDLIQWGK
jgi:hypothetical protein